MPCATLIVACSVARLTLASSTPGTLASAFSTRAEQLAQVMPVMSKTKDSVGMLKPAFSMARCTDTTSVSPVTVTVSVARFTVASVTPGSCFSTLSTRAEQLAQVMPWMPTEREGFISGVLDDASSAP